MSARTWFALVTPPVAWFASLNAAYFMVSWACGSAAGRITMHLTLLAMLAITMVAGVTGRRLWRRAGTDWPGESADPRERQRFLAALATFGAGLFSLMIAAQWIAALVLDPCEPGPRLPFSPSALLDPGVSGALCHVTRPRAFQRRLPTVPRLP